MPLITVHNYAGQHDAVMLPALAIELRETTLGVGELGLNNDPRNVTVVLGGHQILEDDPRVVIVVSLLYEKPERTRKIRELLANRLKFAAKRVLGRERPVEVAIVTFRQDADVCVSG